jgi:hypothetical protein
VSLADARQKPKRCWRAAKNPIEARNAAEAASKPQRALTIDEAVERYIAAHEAAWRNPKHRQQWRNTLTLARSLVSCDCCAAHLGYFGADLA